MYWLLNRFTSICIKFGTTDDADCSWVPCTRFRFPEFRKCFHAMGPAWNGLVYISVLPAFNPFYKLSCNSVKSLLEYILESFGDSRNPKFMREYPLQRPLSMIPYTSWESTFVGEKIQCPPFAASRNCLQFYNLRLLKKASWSGSTVGIGRFVYLILHILSDPESKASCVLPSSIPTKKHYSFRGLTVSITIIYTIK